MQTVAKVCAVVRNATLTMSSLALAFGGSVAYAQEAPEEVPAEASPVEEEVPAAVEEAPAELAPEEVVPADEAPVQGIEAAPEAIAPAEVPVKAPPSHTASYVLWGLGGASLVVGAVFGGLALKAKKKYDDDPSYDGATDTETNAMISDVGLGAGLIFAITGTIWYFVQDDGDDDKTTASKSETQRLVRNDLHVAPFFGARSGGGAVSLRF